ncbi:MAG: hypothetical protein DRR42_09590 [Gammaproteobacteria bacterium]|nr:MAG: hypothetical protein DRR42_09590 [Gammaproteobacteria bacterium]
MIVETGLLKSGFRLKGALATTAWRPTGQFGTKSPPVATIVLIRLLAMTGPLGNAEILKDLGLKNRTRLSERYIDPALADGLVERTISDKPTSRLQQYWLTQ